MLFRSRRIHRYGMLLSNSRGLSIGTSFNRLQPVNFDNNGPNPAKLGVLNTYSGIAQGQVLDDTSYDGMICWRVSRPYPANVAAIAINLETVDQ